MLRALFAVEWQGAQAKAAPGLGLAALWPNVRDSFLGRKCFALYSQLRWQEAQAKAAPGRRTPN